MSNVIWNFAKKHNVPYNELVEFVHTVQATTVEADRVSRDVPDWSQIGKIVDAAAYAASGRYVAGTTNWAAAISRYMLAASPQPVQAQPSEAEKFMDAAGLCRRCAAPVADAPIDMVLHCPACGMQHVDAPDEVPDQPILKSAPTTEHPHKMVQVGTYTAQGEWTNPPHRSHLCHGCGHIWRPADVPTNGVAAIKTKGKADSPVAQPVQAQPSEWQPIETAPKDGTEILAFCCHSANAYFDGTRLTDYGARAEGLSHVGDGVCVVRWGDAYEVSDGWESPPATVSAWWESAYDCEVAANPTHWMPLPPPPATQQKD